MTDMAAIARLEQFVDELLQIIDALVADRLTEQDWRRGDALLVMNAWAKAREMTL